MIIRAEKKQDIPKIFKVNTGSFSSDGEAKLVDNLRKTGVQLISLVAEEGDEICGHILFSPVAVKGDNPGKKIAGLGPMAVLPSYRKKGVGKMLVEEGLNQCLKAGFDAVVVLGHADYYPQFGFVPSVAYGIVSTYDVPDDIFMVKELKKGGLKGVQGIVSYHELFRDEPDH
jgi:putative acetyltransferase